MAEDPALRQAGIRLSPRAASNPAVVDMVLICVMTFQWGLRSAQSEELRAVGGRKGYGFGRAVIGDAGGIGNPACCSDRRAGLFQYKTCCVSGWPGNNYPALREAGAAHRKR